jgi:hypothetical protein
MAQPAALGRCPPTCARWYLVGNAGVEDLLGVAIVELNGGGHLVGGNKLLQVAVGDSGLAGLSCNDMQGVSLWTYWAWLPVMGSIPIQQRACCSHAR